jgi:hypothetical protein
MQTYKEFLTEQKQKDVFVTDPVRKVLDKAIKSGKRDPAAEQKILASEVPLFIVSYAKHDIHGRWPEGEEVLLRTSRGGGGLLLYAKEIIGGRWKEAEKHLDGWSWHQYLSDIFGQDMVDPNGAGGGLEPELKKMLDVETDEDKWKFLAEKGITKESIKLLNAVGIPKIMQEHIIDKRPDLIKLIKDLDPGLRKKYSQELNLSGIEI